MAKLLKFDGSLEDAGVDYCDRYLWILLDGKIEVAKAEEDGDSLIHATVWGPEAWDIATRGYYFEDAALVTCHGFNRWTPQLIRQVARKFPNAIYYK